jgi:hypothetical protein
MTSPLIHDPVASPNANGSPSRDERSPALTDRIGRLEGEVAELRHTLSDLAEIVVGDIKERREAAEAFSAPASDMAIPASLVPGGQSTVNALRRPWLLVDLIKEVGATIRMYTDPRYRIRRGTQLMVPLLFLLFGLDYLVFNYTMLDIPVFRHLLERLVEVVLAILLYKVVSREVARYRQIVAQQSLGPRTWAAVPASLLHNDPETAAVTRHVSP